MLYTRSKSDSNLENTISLLLAIIILGFFGIMGYTCILDQSTRIFGILCLLLTLILLCVVYHDIKVWFTYFSKEKPS